MTKPEEGKWTYSSSEEIFNSCKFFDTKKEAIEAGKEEYAEWGGFFVGQVRDIKFSIGVNVERILEDVSENVYDEVGEVAETYLYDVEKEHKNVLEDRMNDAFREWLKTYDYEPNFFKVVNVENIQLEANHDETHRR